MESKQKYRELCKRDSSIPLPSKDWWLDAVAGKSGWDVVIVENDDQIVGSLPYVMKKKFGFNIILMPRFTPSMGVWIDYPPGQKYATKLSYEKKVCTELIRKLPSFDRFHQRFHHQFSNWLPFFWQGFEQTTRYIYIIEDLSDLDQVFKNFRENIRREIRKAQKKLQIYEDQKITDLYRLVQKTLQRQHKKMSYSEEDLEKLDESCRARGCRKILLAKDEDGRVHAGIYLVWDGEMAYYLQGGSDPELRTSGASSLVMWEAIQYAAKVTRKFNFAGSMMEPIERFFRAFGGIQTPYFAISKNNKFFKIAEIFREKK